MDAPRPPCTLLSVVVRLRDGIKRKYGESLEEEEGVEQEEVTLEAQVASCNKEDEMVCNPLPRCSSVSLLITHILALLNINQLGRLELDHLQLGR